MGKIASMQHRAIWIWASSAENARHIKKIFDEVSCINPVVLMDATHDFPDAVAAHTPEPLLALIDLSMPNNAAWEILEEAQKLNSKICFIALIDKGADSMLDRAYDLGVKSYLKRPFTFAQFIDRSRICNLKSVLVPIPPP